MRTDALLTVSRVIVIWMTDTGLKKQTGGKTMERVETLVNSRVTQLAEYLEIDPKIAQELYYQSGLWNSIDGLEHKARKEELEHLRSLRKALAKHSPKFAHQDVIQTTFRMDGFNLKKTLAHLEEQLDLMVGFGEAKMREETSGTRAIKRAHEVARFVAELFEVDERYVGYGVQPLDGNEPSTPFGRAVREALSIFEVYETPTDNRAGLTIVNWRYPAEKTAAEYRNTNS